MTTHRLIAALAIAAITLAWHAADANAQGDQDGGGWGFSSLFGGGRDRIESASGGPAVNAQASAAEAPSGAGRTWNPLTWNPFSSGNGKDEAPRKTENRLGALSLNTPVGPPSPELHRALAQMAEAKGNIAAARAQLTEAVKLDPEDPATLRAIGRLEDRQGRLDVAENAYRRALELAPNDAGALNDLALCCARQDKLRESAALMEAAVRARPDKTLYRNNIAKVLVELGQPDAALSHLAAAHTPATAQYNLGQLLAGRGDAVGAARCYQQALAIQPNLDVARVALAQLQPSTPRQTAHVASLPRSPRSAADQASSAGQANPRVLPPVR